MKNQLLQGTIILLCSSVLLRCLGFLYQILVVRFAGTESLGILNMTMPFYMLFVVIATMGMPVAITKLTAEYISKRERSYMTQMLNTAFVLVFILSIFCLLIACFIMPQIFSFLQTEMRVRKCFCILIPGILLVPLSSVMRGYFQGMQQMIYPSIGQLIEQLIRVISGLILIVWVSPKDVLSLTMSLACAAMLGEFGGCLLLGIFYLRSRRKEWNRFKTKTKKADKIWLKPLLSLGFPVTGARLTSTIDMAIEASMVPACLIAVGYNHNQAASAYGQFSGVAISLLLIPTVLTSALSTALIPAISSAASRHQTQALQQYCQQTISITWMFSLPVIFVLYLYGEEFGQILFHIDGLGEMMRYLSFGAVFLYIGQTVVGILQGLGMTRTVFINNFCGSAAKLIGMYYCICNLHLGSIGIAGGMIMGYGLQCLMNVAALGQQVSFRLSWKEILLPLGNTFFMVINLQFLETIISQETTASFLFRLVIAAFGYLFILVCTGQTKQLLQKEV